MSNALLRVKDLSVNVGDESEGIEILHHINLEIGPGEVHVLMGPNGAGKSTLGYAVMGNPAYAITSGSIEVDGQDLTDEPANVRAKAGLYLSFQNPLEVPGITMASFIRTAVEQLTGNRVRLYEFRKTLKKHMALLQMDESYLERDLNVGFSGGEKKKAEILQLLAINPKLAILDETDSGLDVDAVKTVSTGIDAYMEQGDRSLLIITHSTRILDQLHVDKTHVLVDGRIVAEGDASMIDDINENGFEKYVAMA